MPWLAQALASAGVRAVVGSLWSVGDSTSLLFMRFFYDALCAGQMVGSALAKARRETRVALPHPVHWAGWVLYGDASVVAVC
jgi:CHAT domain-containing protein